MEKDEQVTYVEIGRRIEQARKREGLTQGQLAELLGYQTPTAISLIEAGKRMIKIAELEKMAEVLHTDLQFLLKGTTDRPPVTVKMALRSEHKDLSAEDVSKIESFIEFVKAENNGRGTTK
jgi:XRE family transcriptional regulator, fatty acid utilization regulator